MKKGSTIKTYPRKCATKRCRGSVLSKSAHSPYCSKCRNRRWAAKFPLNKAFHNLVSHARERGIPITITRSEFLEFAVKSGLSIAHGQGKYCLNVDRKDERYGYSLDNIHSITKSDNSSRQRFVPYFRNKAQADAEIKAADQRAKVCMKIAEELNQKYEPESDEWRAAYAQRTNEAFA
jgi:hypothetical protein